MAERSHHALSGPFFRSYRIHTSRRNGQRTLPPPSAGEGGPCVSRGRERGATSPDLSLPSPDLARGPRSLAEGGGKRASFERRTKCGHPAGSHGDRKPALDPAATDTRDAVHATCLVVGEAGILIRGDSGSGKSSLALALIERAALQGRFAALVGDDRVRLTAAHGRLVARPHPAIAGLIEIRGHGIVPVASMPACVLRLVVDLTEAGPRLPEAPADAIILGIPLPRLRLDRAAREAGLGPWIVLARLGVSSQPHTRPSGVRGPPCP